MSGGGAKAGLDFISPRHTQTVIVNLEYLTAMGRGSPAQCGLVAFRPYFSYSESREEITEVIGEKCCISAQSGTSLASFGLFCLPLYGLRRKRHESQVLESI